MEFRKEDQLEELTGFSIEDYDWAGDRWAEEFMEACDNWWDAKSQKEKQRLFVDTNKPS